MFVDFFIRRPVFATVCALIIILCGAASIPTLPVAQYPTLAPPEVSVNAFYVGASAQVVEAAVTTPLEQQINGTEGMRYMTSQSGSDGSSNITVTFDLTRDIDIAAVDVQNRVSGALGRLPREVTASGVSVFKNSSAMILVAGLYAEHGELSDLFISNYADLYIRDALKRVRGVGNVAIFGERKYAMRLWLDPGRLAARGLTAADVVRSLREQNAQIAAGQVGQQPAPKGQAFQISVRAGGRLSEPDQFARIVLKTGADGTVVLLKDVGTVELGAEDYSGRLRFNGREAVGLGVFQLPGANALEVDRAVRAELERLSRRFPPGLKHTVAFDPTEVVAASIREVIETLAIAMGLVILVIFLFLQDLRSTLIPALTIPVSLIGTFAFVKIFGFSINTLTLFGLTLATGLVVDDAIVVIENIERHMRERKQDARTSSSSAMAEVASAVIATSLVLIAVFVPVALFPGTTGRLYQQFSLTIAFSIAISAWCALTLAPALAALLLGHHQPPRLAIFRGINRALSWLTDAYGRSLRRATRLRLLMLGVFVGLLGLTVFVYRLVPGGFVPQEDQDYFLVLVQAPEGASLSYTSDVMAKVEAALQHDDDVQNIFAVAGWSFGGSAPNRAIIFPNLRPLAKRRGAEHSMEAILGRLRGAFAQIPGALIFAFAPPTIQGASSVGGFSFQVLDQGNSPPTRLAEVASELAATANREPAVTGVFSQFTANDPQVLVEIDRERAKALGVSLTEIADTLSIYMGSQYVNDFDFNARSYRVYVQAAAPFRSAPRDIASFYVRSDKGAMVPLGGLVRISETTAPPIISHFNLFRATEISGSAAPGYSSGQALAAIERAARRALPQDMTFEWSGLTWEEVRASGQSFLIFGLGLLFVFLVLSAQYESFALPFIILLAVPLAILGALGAQRLRGLPNDVFCQIGLVMLIGLASKNAILIVEFAEQLRARGTPLAEAAVEAAQIRLRPILMTSLAFIFGLLPLVFATGAGKAARHSLGTPVLGGMIVSTVLNLYFIPVLYVALQGAREWLRARRGRRGAAGPAIAGLLLLAVLGSGTARAQPAAVGSGTAQAQPAVTLTMERVTLRDALERALRYNARVAVAAAGVRQAAALVRQVRAGSLPTLSGNAVYTRLDNDRVFGDQVFVAADQFRADLTISAPLLAPVRWAQWAEAAEQAQVAGLSAADVRRSVALATAHAYLAVLTERRLVELAERARDTSQIHADYSQRRLQGGVGSQLDQVRAAQELSADLSRVERAQAQLLRAQGALGVLLGQGHPVDIAADAGSDLDQVFSSMPAIDSALAEVGGARADLRLLSGRRQAAAHQVRNTFTYFLPSLIGTFAPIYQTPATVVQPALSWQAQLLLNLPLYDGGLRYGLRQERAARVDSFGAELAGLTQQAQIDLRVGHAALSRAERALTEARRAAELGQRAVRIAELAYRNGATTNLELIDAQRRARDADTIAAQAEDEVRRARVDLLGASGRFP